MPGANKTPGAMTLIANHADGTAQPSHVLQGGHKQWRSAKCLHQATIPEELVVPHGVCGLHRRLVKIKMTCLGGLVAVLWDQPG
jgi:hypothetical protein